MLLAEAGGNITVHLVSGFTGLDSMVFLHTNKIFSCLLESKACQA